MQLLDDFKHKRHMRHAYPDWQHAFSPDALRRAWLAVRGNGGGSGPDGQTIADFERSLEQELTTLSRQLQQGDYKPRRVTQVLVPKANADWRPLTMWTVRDRIAQRAAYNYLEPIIDPRFLPCSYGFRPGRGTKDAAQAIRQAQKTGACWVLDADIRDCFGQMKNKHLLSQLRHWQVPQPLQNLVAAWLKARVWNAWRPKAQEAGTSQGGVISPLLCNLYLHRFDLNLGRRKQWQLVRYADDFVILSHSERHIKQARREVERALKHVGLEINPHKTAVRHFDEGFQFVGWFFVRDEMYRLR